MVKKMTEKKNVTQSEKKSKSLTTKNLTNTLLFFLIILVTFLIIISLVNLFKTNVKEVDLKKDNSLVSDIFVPVNNDLNYDSVIDNNQDNLKEFNLNDVTLPESEFIIDYLITEENISDLKNIYSFIFNESILNEYNYEMTQVGDFILEFKDYILVYDSKDDNVKSMWYVKSVSN